MAEYKLTECDKNVVRNLRGKYGYKIAKYNDQHIAQTWQHFSLSDDYDGDRNDKILEWLAD